MKSNVFKNVLSFQLNDYLKRFPSEKVKIAKTLNLLFNHNDCFKRTNWGGHFTASAWVVDRSRKWILMTHHKKLNSWLQLGGHAESNNNLLEVALKEAKEESGLNDINIVSNKIFDLDIHKIPKFRSDPEHLHYDVRFIFEADRLEKLSISNESNNLAWIEIENVLNLNSKKSIERMVHKFLNQFSHS